MKLLLGALKETKSTDTGAEHAGCSYVRHSHESKHCETGLFKLDTCTTQVERKDPPLSSYSKSALKSFLFCFIACLAGFLRQAEF